MSIATTWTFGADYTHATVSALPLYVDGQWICRIIARQSYVYDAENRCRHNVAMASWDVPNDADSVDAALDEAFALAKSCVLGVSR